VNVRLRKSGPLARLLGFATLGLLVGAGVIVWARTEVTRLRYQLMQAYETESLLRDEVEKLRVEAAALAAPERLEKEARALGLRYPEPGQVVAVSLGEPQAEPRDAHAGGLP
jgi:cell division protein FtsL